MAACVRKPLNIGDVHIELKCNQCRFKLCDKGHGTNLFCEACQCTRCQLCKNACAFRVCFEKGLQFSQSRNLRRHKSLFKDNLSTRGRQL